MLKLQNKKKTRNVRIKVMLRRVRVTTVAVEKQLCITYSESVFVALVIQHAERMRRITLWSMACPAVRYVSILRHKRCKFGQNVIGYKTCFDFL